MTFERVIISLDNRLSDLEKMYDRHRHPQQNGPPVDD